MVRNTHPSLARALGRRTTQVVLVGALAAAPLALGAGLASADTDWDQLAQCESSGNWNTNTGNGFGGGLQFTDSTWHAFGGSGQPEDASREEQIAVAERVKSAQGMSAWPSCSQQTGNTDDSPNSSSEAGSSSAESGSSSAESGSGSSESGSSGSSGAENVAATPAAPAAAAAPAAPGTAYTVAAGDTLSSIAGRHGVAWQDVAARNGLADPNTLQPGQQLALA